MNGLCDDCTHAKRITSSRESEFILCLRSKDDPQFPKYPRLPMMMCLGYEPYKKEAVEKIETLSLLIW
jgi:hypothetical protein